MGENSNYENSVAIIDSVLAKLNLPAIEHGGIFELSSQSRNGYSRIYTRADFEPKLEIEISNSGIDISLFGKSEVFSWSSEDIVGNRHSVFNDLVMILTSKIELTLYGKNGKASRFVFKDPVSGIVNHNAKYIESILVNPFIKVTKEYDPIVERLRQLIN